MASYVVVAVDTRPPLVTLGSAYRSLAGVRIPYTVDEPALIEAPGAHVSPSVLLLPGDAPPAGTITVTATDDVGNAATISVPYQIRGLAALGRLVRAGAGRVVSGGVGRLQRALRGRPHR